MDVAWVIKDWADPSDWIARYADRITAAHRAVADIGPVYVPDPNFFGGMVEIGGRDGSLITVTPSDRPSACPNRSIRSALRWRITAPLGWPTRSRL